MRISNPIKIILAEPGYVSVYRNDDGTALTSPVVMWAIMEAWEYGPRGDGVRVPGENRVVGLDLAGESIEDAEDVGNFLGYAGPGDDIQPLLNRGNEAFERRKKMEEKS
jgi:hypothetical protein